MITSFVRSTSAQEPVVVDHGHVAGAQPAVGRQRRGGGLGVVPVPGEHVGPPDPDLAGVADQRVLPLAVDQAHLDPGQRHADAAVGRVVAEAARHGGRRLGEAVALGQVEAEAARAPPAARPGRAGRPPTPRSARWRSASGSASRSPAHAAHIVGTPLSIVTPCSATAASVECGSNRSTSTTVPPTRRVTPEHGVQPEHVEQRQHAERDVVDAVGHGPGWRGPGRGWRSGCRG